LKNKIKILGYLSLPNTAEHKLHKGQRCGFQVASRASQPAPNGNCELENFSYSLSAWWVMRNGTVEL